jgi:alpha-glucosidase
MFQSMEGNPRSRQLHQRAGCRRQIAALAAVGTLGRGRRGVGCVVNLSAGPVSLPGGAEVRLASGPLDGGRLPADTAVWLRIQGGPAVPG